MINKIRLNDLNKKIRLEKLDNGDWVLEKYVWGKIEVGVNTLNAEHGILENKNSYSIVVRNFTKVDKSMRFVYKNAILYIKHIDNMDVNYLKIFCEG
jgi:hypothetical protein